MQSQYVKSLGLLFDNCARECSSYIAINDFLFFFYYEHGSENKLYVLYTSEKVKKKSEGSCNY